MDDEVVVVVPKKRRKPKKLYQCSTCSYTTNRAYNIQRHLPKHEAKLPKELQHLCPYNGCWFSSLRYDNMTRHIQGLHRSDDIPAKKKAKPTTPKDDAEPVSEPTINTEANPNVEDLACLPQTTDDDIEILSCDEEPDSEPNNEDQACSPMPQTNDNFIEPLSCDEESVSETSAEDQNSPNDDNLPETTYEHFETFEITELTDEDQEYSEVHDLCLPMPQDTYDDIEVLSGYEELISEPADELYELASSGDGNPTSENGDKELKTSNDDITTAQPAENLSTSKPNQIEKESKNQQQNKTNSKKRPLKRKVYKCNCCDYSTNRGFNIKRHLIKHSSGCEVLLHVCIISGCKYSTHRLDSLRRHVKSTHPESS